MAVELAPPKTETRFTDEEVLATGTIGPCELADGRLVQLSPTGFPQGDDQGILCDRLQAWVRSNKTGQVVAGEVGIYARREPDTIRAADVIYIFSERLAQRRQTGGYLDIAPELIVEILPPDDWWQDITQKRREYYSIGVSLIWIADLREFGPADRLTAEEVLPGFAVPVRTRFED